MPLSAATICSLAQEIARCPGFTTQAQQTLNAILSDLCQSYDFVLAKNTFQFNFNAQQLNLNGQAYQNLPANFLRSIRLESFYLIDGVPYPMISVEQEEGDMFVQTAGLANFPVFYWTDMSLSGVTNSASGSGGAAVPVMLFWEVPSGAYPVTVRYYSQMPDITDFTTTPWFPNQGYLIRELAGRLCQLTDDERADALLSSDEDRHPNGSGVMLRKYLILQNDPGPRVKQVTLDRRRFGAAFSRLRNTKQVGWAIPLALFCGSAIHTVLNGGLSWLMT